MNELILCSSRKYPTPLPHGGQWKFRGEGVQKETISKGVRVAFWAFFLGAPSKIDKQAISYVTSKGLVWSYGWT